MIFTYHISRYLCEHENEPFDRRNFIQYLIDNRVNGIQEKEQALNDENHQVNRMVTFCLNLLASLGLVIQNETTSSTLLLRMLCPFILRYQMLSVLRLVQSLRDTEAQITSDSDYQSIVNFLLHRADFPNYPLNADNAGLNQRTVNLLAQLAVIDVSYNGRIILTDLGRVISHRLNARNTEG
jgi:hypothetical protein